MVRGTDGRLIVKLKGINLADVDKAVLALRQRNLTPKEIIIEAEAEIDVENNKLSADYPAEETFKLKAGVAEVQAKFVAKNSKRPASRIGTIDVEDMIGDIIEADVSEVD